MPTLKGFYGPVILRGIALSVMTYGYLSLNSLTVFDTWIRNQYGGHFQFLTIQGLGMAWMTMAVGLLMSAFPSVKGLGYLKRSLLMIALPLAVVISSIYWSLIIFFPELILQPGEQEAVPSSSGKSNPPFRIPLTMDLALHASPALFLLADFWLFETKYSKSSLKFRAPIASAAFAAWYGWWVERCGKYNNGIFPYPFLTENPWEMRVLIYVGASILAVVSFRMINSLHPRNTP